MMIRSALLAASLALPAGAAQNTDSDWPCVQRRVDHLSIGVMWPEPIPEAAGPLAPAFRDVAEQMALRRVSVEEIGVVVDDLAARHPDLDPAIWGQIFADAFARIDTRRTRLMSGIVDYARGQADLARQIDDLRVAFAEEAAAGAPDFDRLDAWETEIDWRERVFDERNSALTYVCETPVLLERRAFAIAQLLLQRVD